MAGMKDIKLFFSVAMRRSSVLGSLKIALVVGIAVNLINQGEYLIGLQFAQISAPKAIITFCIPFCVSIYNSTITRLRYDPGVRAIANVTLTCTTCGNTDEVKTGELVPDCTHCALQGVETQWSQGPAGHIQSQHQ
jgi:hypothetical protein